MKIGALLQVLDESDIIELFIRINSKVIDQFFIIDNNSCDTTCKILDKMKSEGVQITIVKDYNIIDNQSVLITNALQHLSKTESIDWFLFPDADEFFSQSKQEIIQALESTPPALIPLIHGKTWIPTTSKYLSHKAPLYNNFHPLKAEPPVYKVAVDRRRAPFSRISMGAHSLHKINDDTKVDTYDAGITYNHFPIRSVPQIISKSILTVKRSSTNPALTFDKNNNNNIVGTAEQIKLADYKVNDALLKELAINSRCLGSDIAGEVDENQRFGSDEDKLKYPELVDVNLIKRFNNYLDLYMTATKQQIDALQAQLNKVNSPVVMSSMRGGREIRR